MTAAGSVMVIVDRPHNREERRAGKPWVARCHWCGATCIAASKEDLPEVCEMCDDDEADAAA